MNSIPIPPGKGKVFWQWEDQRLDPDYIEVTRESYKDLQPHLYWRPPRSKDKLIDTVLDALHYAPKEN